MRVNKWTLGLAAAGLVSIPSLVQAEEKASAIMTALSSTTISGYVDTSIHWDMGTGNANPPGFVYNAGKQDGFNLNAINLRIDKPLDEAQWAAGYRVDLLFGPNANVIATQSSGLGSGSDFAITQGYVALRAPIGNGLDLKLGVFDTIVGYESYHSGNNPNYTRSYGNTIEPTTHTGLLATYQVNETIGLAAGIANTYGPVISSRAHPVPPPAGAGVSGTKAESFKTYMGAVAFTAPESWGFLEGSTLYGGVINGYDNSPGETRQLYYVGTTLTTPIKGFKAGACYDYSSDVVAPSLWVDVFGVYASFQATEKLSFHGRGEYLWRDGVTAGGFPTKIMGLTGTVQFDLWKNVLSRLELRWDHAADGNEAYGGEGTVATPNRKNAYLLAANVIYKF